jgi:translation initiation factor 2-alpha kinase 4
LARSQINNIKRYSISTVFREVKVFGIHPREQLECAFDIVTPTAGSHLADAEVLFVVDELLRELPKFEESGSYFIRLNHTLLLQGILTNCGIREELHQDIYNVIREGDKWSKNQRLSHLGDLGVSESSAISLFSTLEHEGSVGHIGSLLRHMIRRKTVASNDIKSGLNDLEAIINNATSLGIKCPIVVSPSLVYNPGHFSGMVCQLVRQKKRGNLEIMAAGGRYDHLINCFASNFSLGASAGGQQHTSKEVNQSAVGISLSMDRLVAAVSSSIESHFSAAEVVIYSESHLSKEKSDLVSKLWSSGMKCVVADHSLTLDEAQEYAQEYSAHVIVILRDGEASARVRILEKEQRFLEKKVPCSELVEHLHKSLRPQQESSFENSSGGGSGVSGGTGQPLSSGGLSRMESVKSASGDGRTVQVNYNYRYLDRAKYGASAKKRLESTMSTKITGSLALLAPGTLVEVMPLHLPKAVLKAIAGMLEFEDDASHSKSVLALQERHPRHRKDLGDISDEIRGLKNRGCSVFVLYSADVHFFTLLLAT